MSDVTTYRLRLSSPLGELLLLSDGGHLQEVRLPNYRHAGPDPGGEPGGEVDVLQQTARQLQEYFDGRRSEFDLPLLPHGTEFQRKVWKSLLTIPYAQTISYGELARRIGQPTASRAVGLANGRNPIPIIIPCHRVIGANGSLTGYGGGLECKRILLEMEARFNG